MKNILIRISHYLGNVDISVLFLSLFVFCLPFFKKLNIYSDFSFLDGKYVDYLTYSVYVFDFFLLLVFVCWVIEIIVKKEEPVISNWKINISYLGVIIFSLVSIFYSTDKFISLYYIFILIILWGLFLFIINRLRNKRSLFLFLNTFVFTMFIQSIITVIQFIKNGSIGLSRIGEQILSPKIDGVAKIMFGATKHIRSYGTFSHPNILALFLVVAGVVTLYLLFNYKDRIYKIFTFVSFIFIAIALLLTFSRTLWLLAMITWGVMFYKQSKFNIKKFKKLLPYCMFILFLFALVVAYLYPAILWRINLFDSTFWQSFNDRMVIFGKAWIMIKSHFFGIGIGNFVIEEAYLLTGYPLWMAEPVHNTYLLVLAEIGWFGLFSFLSFIYFLSRSIKKIPLYLKCIFLVIIIYMLFDHCFWDLRQAQILAMIFFALMYVYGYITDKEVG